MNVVDIIVTSGMIVIGSEWAQGKTITAKVAVGTFFAAWMMSLIAAWNAGIAQDLALVILVTTVIVEGPPLLGAINTAVK